MKTYKYMLIQADGEFFTVDKIVKERSVEKELKHLKKIHNDGIEVLKKKETKIITKRKRSYSRFGWLDKITESIGPKNKEITEKIKPLKVSVRELGVFEKEPKWIYEKLKQNPNYTLKEEYDK